MVKSLSELDADGRLRDAIKALHEAAWHLRVASYSLEEECAGLPSGLPSADSLAYRRALELGACMASADTLAAQVEAIGTQTRRLRKRAREI